jgi:hypothetical protein
MKLRIAALSLALLAPLAQAQYAYDDYDSRSGDAAFDAVLDDMNVFYVDDPEWYQEQIAYETSAPRAYVREYIEQRHYAPADVYMIGEVAQASGKSFGDVANAYEANRAQGWGALARSMGIKPGSAQFHALKNGSTGIVERGKGHGKGKHAATPAAGPRVVDATPARGHGQGHPAKGNKGNKGNGKGKGKHK